MIKRLINRLFLKLGYVPIMGTLIVEKQDFQIEEIGNDHIISYRDLSLNHESYLYWRTEELKKEMIKNLTPFVEIEIQDNIPYQQKRIYGRIFVARKK